MRPLAGCVLDASALIAYLQDEPGSAVVEEALLEGAIINVVNYSEVLTRLAATGEDPEAADGRIHSGLVAGGLLEIVPVTVDDALTIARLRAVTQSLGLSIGDRSCLATALRLGLQVLTADRVWAQFTGGPTIRLIR